MFGIQSIAVELNSLSMVVYMNPPCRSTETIPKGLAAPKGQSIEITFHVLLQKSIWEWNDDSEMYIQFGSSELGNWECDFGPMSVKQ